MQLILSRFTQCQWGLFTQRKLAKKSKKFWERASPNKRNLQKGEEKMLQIFGTINLKWYWWSSRSFCTFAHSHSRPLTHTHTWKRNDDRHCIFTAAKKCHRYLSPCRCRWWGGWPQGRAWSRSRRSRCLPATEPGTNGERNSWALAKLSLYIFFAFLLLAQSANLFLHICVLPPTPTDGATRILSLTPMPRPVIKLTSVQMHLFEGP